MPSTRSGWTTERQCASIMIATACSIGSPSPMRTAPSDRLHRRRRVVRDLLRDAQCRAHEIRPRIEFVDHAKPVRLVCGDWLSGHQHLHGLARREHAGEQDRRAAAGTQADHRFGLPEQGIVGGDDEIRTDGDLATAAVRHSVDRGNDGSAQLSQRVENTIEHLALAQPFLLRHALALSQVAANGEGPVTGSRQDDGAHRGTRRERLEYLDQLSRQLRRDCVVGMRPVERDKCHTPPETYSTSTS